MFKHKTAIIRILCCLALVAATLSLAVPQVHAVESNVPATFTTATSAAARRVRLAKLPRHYRSPLAGEGSTSGLWQALIVEALIGAIGVGATIGFVNHRRRQHPARPWQI